MSRVCVQGRFDWRAEGTRARTDEVANENRVPRRPTHWCTCHACCLCVLIAICNVFFSTVHLTVQNTYPWTHAGTLFAFSCLFYFFCSLVKHIRFRVNVIYISHYSGVWCGTARALLVRPRPAVTPYLLHTYNSAHPDAKWDAHCTPHTVNCSLFRKRKKIWGQSVPVAVTRNDRLKWNHGEMRKNISAWEGRVVVLHELSWVDWWETRKQVTVDFVLDNWPRDHSTRFSWEEEVRRWAGAMYRTRTDGVRGNIPV